MLQQALAGGADILSRSISGECKVWLLRGRGGGELRAVVINKDARGRECGVDIRLAPDQLKRYAPEAAARYMYAAAGLSDRWRIYYSGDWLGEWGSAPQWNETRVPVAGYTVRDAAGRAAGGGFALRLTNGTLAALVTLPLAPAGARLGGPPAGGGAAAGPASGGAGGAAAAKPPAPGAVQPVATKPATAPAAKPAAAAPAAKPAAAPTAKPAAAKPAAAPAAKPAAAAAAKPAG